MARAVKEAVGKRKNGQENEEAGIIRKRERERERKRERELGRCCEDWRRSCNERGKEERWLKGREGVERTGKEAVMINENK